MLVIASNAGYYLVVAFFETGAEARGAMVAGTIAASNESRKGWIGMLVSDDRGCPEVVGSGDDVDERSLIGDVLGVIASALVAGAMPSRNDFFDGRSELTADDVVRFGAELEAGHAAVAVLAPRARADRILVLLAGMGGKAEIHHLSDHALREAESAGVPPPRSRA